jgi:hypothetical protein
LNLTLKNKGRFNVDGFVVRVNDREGAGIGLYTFDENGTVLEPAQVYNEVYNFEQAEGNESELTTITLIEVQPYVVEQGEIIYCESVSSQNVLCG